MFFVIFFWGGGTFLVLLVLVRGFGGGVVEGTNTTIPRDTGRRKETFKKKVNAMDRQTHTRLTNIGTSRLNRPSRPIQ